MDRGLKKLLSKAKTRRERLLLMFLALPEKEEQNVALYLETVLGIKPRGG